MRSRNVVGPTSSAEVGRRAAGFTLACAVLVVLLAGCSSEAPAEPAESNVEPIAASDAPLRVESIRDAVSAVEAELGGPQRFFEVNATPTIVNVFVATSDATQAVAYVYAVGQLEEAAPPQPASGPTFGSADIDFDETLVLTGVRGELPTSDFRLFSVTGIQAGGVQYRAVINSTQGTEFVVFLSGDGAVLGTDQSLGIGDS